MSIIGGDIYGQLMPAISPCQDEVYNFESLYSVQIGFDNNCSRRFLVVRNNVLGPIEAQSFIYDVRYQFGDGNSGYSQSNEVFNPVRHTYFPQGSSQTYNGSVTFKLKIFPPAVPSPDPYMPCYITITLPFTVAISSCNNTACGTNVINQGFILQCNHDGRGIDVINTSTVNGVLNNNYNYKVSQGQLEFITPNRYKIVNFPPNATITITQTLRVSNTCRRVLSKTTSCLNTSQNNDCEFDLYRAPEYGYCTAQVLYKGSLDMVSHWIYTLDGGNQRIYYVHPGNVLFRVPLNSGNHEVCLRAIMLDGSICEWCECFFCGSQLLNNNDSSCTCGEASCEEIDGIGTLGKTESELVGANHLIASPNPFSAYCDIRGIPDDVRSISILSISGANIKSINIQESNFNNGILQLDLSELHVGIYFIQVTSNDNQYMTKIIKQ